MDNMNLGNMYHYKKKYHPDWYVNGEATTFSPAQIKEYEESEQGKRTLAKAAEIAAMDPELIKFLDAKKSGEAESEYKEQMKGFKG